MLRLKNDKEIDFPRKEGQYPQGFQFSFEHHISDSKITIFE